MERKILSLLVLVISICPDFSFSAENYVEEFSKKYCARCHGGGSRRKSRGGFGSSLSLKQMIAEKRIVPSSPEKSIFYQEVFRRVMPPSGNKPSIKEIEALKKFIENLPARSESIRRELSYPAILEAIYEDLKRFTVSKRKNLRYIDLISESQQRRNDGSYYYTGSEIEGFVQAVRFLINSLSFRKALIEVEQVEDSPIIRVNFNSGETVESLSHLGIRPSTWRYIGNILQNEDFLIDYQGETWDQITENLESQYPILPGASFARYVTRDPGYYRVMNFPSSLTILERLLGISLKTSIKDRRVLRGFTTDSGVSANHRIVEWHPIGQYSGEYWKSYDFKNNVGRRNVYVFPLGPNGIFGPRGSFQHDGGEVIFNLPNGLQAYVLVDSANRLLEGPAPSEIVSDSRRNRTQITNAINCFGCHGSGLKSIKNVLKPNFNIPFIDSFVETVHNQEKLNDKLSLGNQRYKNAFVSLKTGRSSFEVSESLFSIVDRFDFQAVDKSRFQSELHISDKEFQSLRRKLGRWMNLSPQGSVSRRLLRLRKESMDRLNDGAKLDRREALAIIRTLQQSDIYDY